MILSFMNCLNYYYHCINCQSFISLRCLGLFSLLGLLSSVHRSSSCSLALRLGISCRLRYILLILFTGFGLSSLLSTKDLRIPHVFSCGLSAK